MKKLEITVSQLPQYNYPIFIGSQILPKITELFPVNNYTKAVIITDIHIAPHFLELLTNILTISTYDCVINAGDKAKTIETLQQIWQKFADIEMDRKSIVINLGGGVIGDIGGFAASTYMRGVDFINIPTSTLSQVDESVGGKTGINFAGIKNLIGTFHQPQAVIIDVATLETLPEREFNAGFAEIIKHGLIADKEYYKLVTSKKPTEFSQEELLTIITRSCEIKAEVVQEDTKEKGKRKILNFGHTIGHALEALSFTKDKALLHGEAISLGIIAEAQLSHLNGFISQDDAVQIKKILKQAGLPVALPDIDENAVRIKMKQDKKIVDNATKWTLLKTIGKAIYDQEVSDDHFLEALKFISN